MHLTSELLRERTREPLPLPGRGRTRDRHTALEEVGREDLSLAKLVEPHHDAVAIGLELDHPVDPDDVWAVWASEPPFAVLHAERSAGGWRLEGRKAFCSGAELVTHALVTAQDAGRSRLFAVRTDDPGVRPDTEAPAWVGPGMVDARTVTLRLDGVVAEPVGAAGDYTARPGFWHGAAGVAAVWLGGARAVADVLERSSTLDAHGAAHRGAVRAALLAAASVLDRVALDVDADASRSHEPTVLAARAVVAGVAAEVVERVGRATGPGPLAFDPGHARRVADLQVFVRQHHAERDLARLGAPEGT